MAHWVCAMLGFNGLDGRDDRCVWFVDTTSYVKYLDDLCSVRGCWCSC